VIHVPVGVASAWLGAVSWPVCLVFGASFLAYEVLEDWRIADKSYIDVAG
jgi:hypothetical protein